ncbi:hypothetical protein SACE_1197 [Saccharopolyspora erythraea NRRL 2338]|uniref:Uncharacterized protein n=1 Tax=Saccharopolyspora erythraea (strain ATCC 11635 / DSM 40517 / JCM 4748 / NBRC 13426 / NCIMB 8594 / NRRL 2338) TaxID=405948 RepID=A4F8Z8_SACEN|nr:hypothetical protein SACE_1197 [Saccharopolyspora erythraea NRRL 2338]
MVVTGPSGNVGSELVEELRAMPATRRPSPQTPRLGRTVRYTCPGLLRFALRLRRRGVGFGVPRRHGVALR